jgi:hypothetical protein
VTRIRAAPASPSPTCATQYQPRQDLQRLQLPQPLQVANLVMPWSDPTVALSTPKVNRLTSAISSSLSAIGAARLRGGLLAAEPPAAAGATPASRNDATPATRNASARLRPAFRLEARFACGMRGLQMTFVQRKLDVRRNYMVPFSRVSASNAADDPQPHAARPTG